jgi:hypothetical protein
MSRCSPPCSRVSNRRPEPSTSGFWGWRSSDSSSNSWYQLHAVSPVGIHLRRHRAYASAISAWASSNVSAAPPFGDAPLMRINHIQWKTQSRPSKNARGEDIWFYLTPEGTWKQTPQEIIHPIEEETPTGQPVLVIWDGKEVCFWVGGIGVCAGSHAQRHRERCR